ncbi:hypothetical protein SMACR_06884 [Sordaria macrospora]|uniref:WGS project CABT00000000 data, contig 2.38 n=2 Tax=Sordaria macrospora TaxID=5147 RepID=F7W795_SORMK|nr:uncharacterized protein SMAC_06884 [Sordaria macrospora k-hell]KAA8633649.1 hypothetical protein SMACR_06884 [Sordaria macrospora]KAH7634055.1 hypothetical protein B0T09DRAFT_319330 [Sordaria sp. MPI-SDFR-AT-0083]WPJ59591.1 hypothetical protein SMAC4_06884 [Sordaria macrospora]CCC13386.1 unnamed protein product [Sordaria macrospora k-hell]
MSRNGYARRKTAEEWSKRLEDMLCDKDSITYTLHDLFEEIDKRVAPVWGSNDRSIVWQVYFVAALRKLIKRMNSPVKAAATPNGKNEASKPVDTSTTDTTFKVDTEGDYKARIVEDCTTKIFEFTLNGPATVMVQITTTETAAARSAAQLGALSIRKK